MPDPVLILTMKWGTLYGAEDVNRALAYLRRIRLRFEASGSIVATHRASSSLARKSIGSGKRSGSRRAYASPSGASPSDL